MAHLLNTSLKPVSFHLHHSKKIPRTVKGYYSISGKVRSIAFPGYTASSIKSKPSMLITDHHYNHRANHTIAFSSKDASAVLSSDPEEAIVYRKGIWDDSLFAPDNQLEQVYGETVEKLKKQVRRMVVDEESKPEDKMVLIDLLERLGVAHNFEHEIEDKIQQIFKLQAQDWNKNNSYDLLTTSLQFRLFRQHGLDAPSSVFNKFIDEATGEFKESLSNDVMGLLSLHEATYLRCQGEDILKEGKAFASRCLKLAKPLLSSHLQQHVTRALQQSAYWGNPRIEAFYYISFYEKEESKNELLLKFAKYDFNLVQNLYKQEISTIFKWWKDLNLNSKLPYLRNRVVEAYFWGMSVMSEPRYSLARICSVKTLTICIVLNDTFDTSAATYEDKIRFLQIMQQRWDNEQNMYQLPYYFKVAREAILSTYEDFDREITKQGRAYAVSYAIQALKNLAARYVKKCAWYNGVETPTFEENIGDAFVDIAGQPIIASCLMGMESVSEDAFQWLMSKPLITEASGLYCRLANNVATYQRESEENQLLGTSIYCYMQDYGVSTEEAMAKMNELADDAMLIINKEWVSTNCVSKEIMKPMVGWARAAYASYLEGIDGYSEPEATSRLKEEMEAIFIHPIMIV